jgi:hypothetical protein
MAQPRSSTRSNNPNTTGKHPKQPQFADRQGPRAHRGDTPEARTQRARAPKTHPTRQQGRMRHDKSGGGGGRK